jgi:predicted AAA+ superfamily ATPase
MQESLILHRIKYFDTKGKSILKTKNKYYAGDLGLLSARTTFNIHDKYSYRLENLIFLELKRRGYEVYTYEDDRNEREIDFIAKQGKELTYYQVATVLTDENYERESRILLKQKDGFQKCIICLENNTSLNNDGIKIINLYE